MNISNVMGSADTSVVAASKKNKWKLTDSLKDKIAEMAKKDAQNNEYMGNEFKSLRKSEISKVAPDRAALIGKFSYLTGSGNASVMKEVQEADKRWLCMLFGEPYEAKCQGKESSPFLCVNSSFSYIKYVYAAFIFSNVL